MRGPGITIGAPMLATLVRVHGISHGQVGTFDLVDYGFWMHLDEFGLRVGQLVFVNAFPMLLHETLRLKPVVWIELRSPTLYILLLFFFHV